MDPSLRPFEVVLGAELEAGRSETSWFARHGRTSVRAYQDGLLPDRVLAAMKARVGLVQQHRELKVLEAPEHKRRWEVVDWDSDVAVAMRSYLMRQAEETLRQTTPTTRTTNDLTVAILASPKAAAIAELLAAKTGHEPGALVRQCVIDDAVPFLACLRYNDSGLTKHAAWQQTWDLQRREDAGEQVDIPVPPRYKPNDFRAQTYWRHRGKLDVPKERFISYPGAESDNDPSPLIGWAGWDHLQQATALYQQRKDEDGWGIDRLTPLLAGMWEQVPWLKQWHNEPSDEYGGLKLGDFYETFVKDEVRTFNITIDDLKAWRPPKTTRGKAKKKTSSPSLSPEALLGAAKELLQVTDDITQKELAEHVGVSSATVGKVAASLVEQGVLVETSKRPKRYALAQS
jgi:biotin operon repressor